MTNPISVRLSEQLTAALDDIAVALDRPRTWVIEQALQEFVTEQQAIIADVRQAQADMRAGKGRAWEDVKADMRRIIDEHKTAVH